MEGWEIVLLLLVLEVGLVSKMYIAWKLIKWAWSKRVDEKAKDN